MNKTYRILPSAEDMLLRLLRGLALTDEERALLRACVLRHVEVSAAENTWELVIGCSEVLDEGLIVRMKEQIAANYQLASAHIQQNAVSLAFEVKPHWERIVSAAAGGDAVLFHTLLQAEYAVDGNVIRLSAPGTFGVELFAQSAVAKRIETAVRTHIGCACRVVCMETELGEVHAPAWTPPVMPVAVKKEAPAAAAPARAARGAKPKELPANVILGRGVSGEARDLGVIEDEVKNVVLEGEVFAPQANQLKSGAYILLLKFADRTNGIACKKFFGARGKTTQEDVDAEVARILKAIGKGCSVRIQGKIEYDKFISDYVLFIDSMEKRSVPQREDTAEVKRVELHAHTKMSALDAVVPPKVLVETAARWGWPAVAITDHGVVQAFPEAMNTARALKKKGTDIKIIYGMEGYLLDKPEDRRAHHIIFLAQNKTGLYNLYRLVSLSHIRYFRGTKKRGRPCIPRAVLQQYRAGIIVGSACEAGELIRGIVAGRPDEELEEIAKFYDFLEIQPIHNNDFLKFDQRFPMQTDEDLRDINRKVDALARKLDKMLIATCDVHFLNPEDAVYRAMIQKANGYNDADRQPPLYLRTTDEMLAEFDYLGAERAYECVVTNPRKIADMVEHFLPIPDELYAPTVPGADREIQEMSYARARKLYGENLPKVVSDRLELELKPILKHGFSALYIIAQRLVKKSNDDGYLVGSRGSVGSSFVATMIGVTEVNPLPPHYRCRHCQYNEFRDDGSVGSGFDLPSMDCPVCGTPLTKDGHNIPFAVFLGFDGDKVPDIDLNFSGDYQPTAHKYTEVLFGKMNVFRAGTISGLQDKNAFGYAMRYYEDMGETKGRAYIEHMMRGCMGVKATTGQHAGGIMVVPRDMDVHYFTPIQRPANNMESDTLTTHFDYHSISERLVKLDILGHDDPTVIKMLEELTHRDPETIPFDDPATMSIFTSTEALGITPEELGANMGTYGIPEFRTSFTQKMIDDSNPDCFADLVRISGFSHGTNVWLGNAQDLIKAGTSTLKDAISARDDIMNYLMQNGIEPLLSFKTMENVRKGKGIAPDVVEKLRTGGIPEWYIDSCQKIKYLFPRAHATAYVMMGYRIAFCKVHYPLAYYAAYFSIRADEFDANIISKGKDAIKAAIDGLNAEAREHRGKLDNKKQDILIVLQLAWEMYLRGFSCEPVDLYTSDAEKFILHDTSLLPPLTALPGMGQKAAQAIVEARQYGRFISIEDLATRAHIPTPAVELLREHGCLDGMMESNQVELFA
ncbi:PolC-type DNA polymerase III [uncultured Selenomonas sp.]|uniref:PolC-type DNA polymerase III n=1 Tax=uncultured Selenomonas sp. TaxID=159275 RepID=UPI0028E3ED22|nr:PolC-type DNA polymerase III [uncultured Selenomonas sp.]